MQRGFYEPKVKRGGRHHRVFFPSCQACGKTFTSPHGSRRFCSADCRVEGTRAQVREKRQSATTFDCRECGVKVEAGYPDKRRGFCGPRCNRRFAKRQRRHALRAAGPAERFGLLEIGNRDGWRCHICGLGVSRAEATLDHLVPVSAGGAHTRANVALAHGACNTLRRDVGPAQLRLLG